MMKEDTIDPFVEVEQREIPNQDDFKLKRNLLAVYMIFLGIGVIIWIYCGFEGASAIPEEFENILKEKLGQNVQEINFEFAPKKTEIKLNFHFISSKIKPKLKWKSEKFEAFLNLLNEEISFKLRFSRKFLEEDSFDCENSVKVEKLMKLLKLRDETGREDILNFILIENCANEKMILIKNWGIINCTTEEGLLDADKTFLIPFIRQFLGFKDSLNTWKTNLNHFYLKRSFEMISQLKGKKIPSKILETKLKPAIKLLKKPAQIRNSFDLIDSAFHDPNLISSAYFPDDHKFAVYLPVYLPLILPILMAFIKELKRFFRRRLKLINSKSKQE